MKFFFYLEQNIKLLQEKYSEKHPVFTRAPESYCIRCYNTDEWRVLSAVFRYLGYDPIEFSEHRYKQSDFTIGNPLCVGINGICLFLNEGGRGLFRRRYDFQFICQTNINLRLDNEVK